MSSSTRNKRILVVEDEPGIREVCWRTLASEEYQVDFASNGAIAEDILTEEDYDLIVIDIMTPVMSGKQLYECIKDRHPKFTDRVVFTTGDVISNNTKYFLEQSNRPFLLKPFTPDELRIVVGETLSQLH